MIACAYNFPAVLQAFGANKWPQLSKIFHTLIKKSAEVDFKKITKFLEMNNFISNKILG
jgi:hypothetical protein